MAVYNKFVLKTECIRIKGFLLFLNKRFILKGKKYKFLPRYFVH